MNTYYDIDYDVLLLYPEKRFRFFDDMIPLGLASLAAVLEQHDYRVKMVDLNTYNGDFNRDVLRWHPRVVGIGGTTPSRRQSFKLARTVKALFPAVPVVYGGNHATFAAADTLMHVPEIDYVIKGEGEYSFLAFCNSQLRGNRVDMEKISGLCWRENTIIRENRAERINDLTVLPSPARHLMEGEYDLSLDFTGQKADFIMTSRGCPAACSFCSAARMFPGGVRYRSLDAVENEIRQILSRKSITALKIFDSTFTSSREHVLEFCRRVRKYGLAWECEVRADSVDFELLRSMHESGCVYIDMGLETAQDRLLRNLHKHITVQQVDQVLAWCRQLGIRTKLFMIFGHMDQTYAECLRDIKYLKERRGKIDNFAVAFGVRVFPGTQIEQDAHKQGLLPKGFSWARYRAPIKNYFLCEFSDVMLLFQRQLSVWKLVVVGLKLHLQGTIMAPGLLWRVVLKNGKIITRFIHNSSKP
jgi:radical SAM superfamily enzyme YgiQ (UPF0313 family)